MRKLVTLTTDFGLRDSYVAELKGALYAEGPSALEVVDLSHEIGPQNVREAALFVRAAWPRFPAGTLHLVVVDPGVGSTRRALAVAACNQLWLGPDNGVLSLVLRDQPAEVVALEPGRFTTRPVSATFHGRDVFAPAAARLAHGAALDELGARVTSPLVSLPWPHSVRSPDGLHGEVVHVDHFGNLISNVSGAELAELAGPGPWEGWCVRVRDGASIPIVRCYADAQGSGPVALLGSSDWLEVAIANGHASRQLGATVGAAMTIERNAC
ncbi:MAG: SAM-dependent chlorinase/fluorinase [Polyangiales bacterium]